MTKGLINVQAVGVRENYRIYLAVRFHVVLRHMLRVFGSINPMAVRKVYMVTGGFLHQFSAN